MDDMFEFSPRRDRLYKQVADRIEQLIVAESLRPGDKLPSERELAEQMGVSRTVVREAIRVLSVRGLLQVKSGCGTYVQELSAKDAAASIGLFLKLRQGTDSLAQLYEVRRILEVEAAGLAAERATADDMSSMRKSIQLMADCQDEPEEYTRHDVAFHTAVVAATHNDLFGVLLSPISDQLRRMVRVSLDASGAAAIGLAHHGEILECIREHDSQRARQAMREHLQHAQELVEKVRRQEEVST
jgi:GntR family transcriptional repressor for pyruvate dehydrogenase complex